MRRERRVELHDLRVPDGDAGNARMLRRPGALFQSDEGDEGVMANRHPTSQQKSRQQHAAEGTLRKEHTDLRSAEPTPGAPDPPKPFTSADAQAEWDRLVWAFNDMGYLAKIDQFVLWQHCNLFAEVEAILDQQRAAQAGLEILEENLAHIDKKELPHVFSEIVALHKIVSKCTDQLRNGRNAIRLFLVEHGLTPGSRGRIKLPAKEVAVDPFTAFQQRRAAGQ
jgi:phage terminase small subunit